MIDEFSPNQFYKEMVAPQVDGTLPVSQAPLPDQVPASDDEYTVRVAERCLEQALGNLGHHEEIRQSMEAWQDDAAGSDDDPGYWREMVFTLSPHERNFGEINGEDDEQLQKANTIISWFADAFSEDQLADVEDGLRSEYKEAWIDLANEQRRLLNGKELLSHPPNDINGWEQIPAPGFGLAYYGTAEDGALQVICLFEMDGYVRLWAIDPFDWATHIRHRVGLDVDGMMEYRQRSLGKPGPDSWAEGAWKLESHLNSHPGDQRYRPNLVTLDETGPGGRTHIDLTADLSTDPDSIRVDDISPPGDWTLAEHTTSTSKYPSRTSRTIWDHPFYGQLEVAVTWMDETGTGSGKARLASGVVPDAYPLVERVGQDRAYDAAIQFMVEHPGPDSDIVDGARRIAEQQDAVANGDGEWHSVEQEATLVAIELRDQDYGPETIHRVVKAGNALGGTGDQNLPTLAPLVEAGVPHPEMSSRMREKTEDNANRSQTEAETDQQSTLAGF